MKLDHEKWGQQVNFIMSKKLSFLASVGRFGNCWFTLEGEMNKYASYHQFLRKCYLVRLSYRWLLSHLFLGCLTFNFLIFIIKSANSIFNLF